MIDHEFKKKLFRYAKIKMFQQYKTIFIAKVMLSRDRVTIFQQIILAHAQDYSNYK